MVSALVSGSRCVAFFDKTPFPLECDRIARTFRQTQCFEPNRLAMNWLEGVRGISMLTVNSYRKKLKYNQ